MTNIVLLRIVLVVLAIYHLVAGVASVFSFGGARWLARVYGANIEETPQLRYAVRMMGLYAFTVGAVLILAAIEPSKYQPLIYIVAGLQVARAVSRVYFRRELEANLGMPAPRNAIAVGLLVSEAVVLLVAAPR